MDFNLIALRFILLHYLITPVTRKYIDVNFKTPLLDYLISKYRVEIL